MCYKAIIPICSLIKMEHLHETDRDTVCSWFSIDFRVIIRRKTIYGGLNMQVKHIYTFFPWYFIENVNCKKVTSNTKLDIIQNKQTPTSNSQMRRTIRPIACIM